MTDKIKRAIAVLEVNKLISSSQTEFCESVDLAIQALEKQIAKKLLDDGMRIPFSYYCPNCKEELSDDGYKPDDEYCCNCGQKLESRCEDDR